MMERIIERIVGIVLPTVFVLFLLWVAWGVVGPLLNTVCWMIFPPWE